MPRRFALGLLIASVFVAACRREPDAPPKDEKNERDEKAGPAGPFSTTQTPDGQPLVVTFPGKPEWTDVPGVKPPVKGFVWAGDDKSKPCAAWVWTIPPHERNAHPDGELSSIYANRAEDTKNAYHFSRWDANGLWQGGWQSKPLEGRAWPGADKAGAGSVLIVGDKAYCLRVSGSELAAADPECKTFFDSLQPAELKDRPPTAKAPGDDLRPLARDGRFTRQAAVGTHSNGIAFLPSRNAVLRGSFTYTFSGGAPWVSRFARYKYPTFEPDGEYAVAENAHIVATDDARGRVYVTFSASRCVRLDIPATLGAGNKEPLPETKSLSYTGWFGLAVAPDGRLFALQSDEGKNPRVVRIDPDEMAIKGEPLPLTGWTTVLRISPDGKTLYAGSKADPGERCTVHEIDVAGWKVRRSFTVRGTWRTLVCGGDGRLYLTDRNVRVRVDPTGPGEPVVRMAAPNDSYDLFLLSPDAKRLYAMGDGFHPYSLDTKELFDFGRTVVAPESMAVGSQRQFGSPADAVTENWPYSPGGVMSPDGKCLLLDSGHAFWLTGAGPLPEVPAAAKWKP